MTPENGSSGEAPETFASRQTGKFLSEDGSLPRREFLKYSAKMLCLATFASTFGIVEEILAMDSEKYDPTQHNYAMGIDIDKCIGCGRCAAACKKENDVPTEPFYFRTWVEQYITPNGGETRVESPNGGIDGFSNAQSDEDVSKTFFVPKMCNHCANPPCVQVCPVGATFKSQDGVVLVDEKYCVGCRYCIQACPYGARYMHPQKHVADKCTLCYHRITKGQLPACVEVCPTKARIFGDLGQQNSPIRRFLRFNDTRTLKAELNTKPKVFYAGAGGEVR